MSMLDRLDAQPLPFAQLLEIVFRHAEAECVEAEMVVTDALCTSGERAHGDPAAGMAAFKSSRSGGALE